MILLIVMRCINYLNIHMKRKVHRNSTQILKKALFQFRIGTYKLPVNNRRNIIFSRNKRLCKICNKAGIRDEIHFLYECSKLDGLRIKYMSSYIRMNLNVPNFIHMLQNNDLGTTDSLAMLYICYRTLIQTQLTVWQRCTYATEQ